MTTSFRLFLESGTELAEDEDGTWIVGAPSARVTLGKLPGSVVRALDQLVRGGRSLEELDATVLGDGGYGAIPDLHRSLHALEDVGLLRHRLELDAGGRGGGVSIEPIVPGYRPGLAPIDPEAHYRLSRYALLRISPDGLLLESPLAPARLRIPGRQEGKALLLLARPCQLDEFQKQADGMTKRAAGELLALLADAEFLITLDDEVSVEETNEALVQWEFHDLLFHARSRQGRHADGYGGNFRLRDRLDPLPAIRPAGSNASVPLYAPDVEDLVERDSAFTRVLEERRSRREQGATPLTDRQLGEFLFRSARARSVELSGDYETSRRVYPGGGACYELEVYVAVNRCRGLDGGLYHYDPQGHSLERISGRTPAVVELLSRAGRTAASAPPQVLLVLSARFRRVFWKYASMGYALILKDVGALFQTMYLVAEAMGLGACALGGGNADLFCSAAGTDYLEESSVGELMLGSRPP